VSSLEGEAQLWCPSAQPDWAGAVAHAIVSGTAEAPLSRPLDRALPVTPELLQLASPVEPTEVFRFAAPCLKRGCRNYAQDQCTLGRKVALNLPIALAGLPACPVRRRCRWFHEQGSAVCNKCPQVVTDNVLPDSTMRWVADPDNRTE
jgi:hypothetical protein